jgi:hypothetical protein
VLRSDLLFLAFAEEVLALSLEIARWILMYAKLAKRCLAASLSVVYILFVSAF